MLHDRHNDYARSAVIAHFRLMPTALRHRHLEARILQDPERLELEESDPRRTIQWGTTKLEEHGGRFLGVADLVRKFDTDEVDGKGRKLGWALALMEMLVDPMLVAWVPSWLREQYERRNPFFRACLRQALKTCNDEYVLPRAARPRCKKGVPRPPATPPLESEEKTPNPYWLAREAQTNARLLRLVRRRMIVRFLRHKAEHPEDDVAADWPGADSDDDGRERKDEESSDDDEDPAVLAKRLEEDVEMIRGELPTADGVDEAAPGEDAWARATAEQRLSAASSAPAAVDTSLGVRRVGLHVDGASVNPPGFAWHELPGNIPASLNTRMRDRWAAWRKAGTALSGDGLERGRLDVWLRL